MSGALQDVYGKNPDGFMSYDALINLTLDKVYVPRSVKAYYRLSEYFSSYTIVGTAFRKISQFPLAKINVHSDDDSVEAKGEYILSKIKLKEKLVRANLNYWMYGIAYMFPMFPVKKFIICKECGKRYLVKDLHEGGSPTYVYDGESFYYSCTNSKCNAQGRHQTFDVHETYVSNPEDLQLAVWSPNRVTCVHNTVTDEKEYYYTLDAEMYRYISEKNHFIISTMPQVYIESVKKNAKVRINSDTLFVMEFPTLRIAGLPLPPIVNVVHDLYQRMKYMQANRSIADDNIVPLRMIFPIHRSENGGRPPVNTVTMEDWKGYVNNQLSQWRKNRNHIVVAPVELGTKYAFGEGKLLVMNDQLRANVEDILAGLGIPREFIYGGATWSRQNVSSIVLENMLQANASEQQGVLDYVAEVINKNSVGKSNIQIKIDIPRLVEQMTELAYLQAGKDKGEISNSTFWKRFGIDDKRERKIMQRESREIHELNLQRAVDQGEMQAEQASVMMNYEEQRREFERRESLKDSLSQMSIQRDQMNLQDEFQRKMIEFNAQMQNKAIKDQMVIQHEMLPYQVEQIKTQLQISNEENLNSQRKMMELNQEMQEKMMEVQHMFRLKTLPVELFTMNAQNDISFNAQKKSLGLMVDQAQAEVEAQFAAEKKQQELSEQEQLEQQQQLMQQVYESLDDERKKQLDSLESDEEKEQQLMQLYEDQQLQEFAESLPTEQQELLQAITDDASRKAYLSKLYERMQEDAGIAELVQQDPDLLKEHLRRLAEDEKNNSEISAMAFAYNKVSGDERAMMRNVLLKESPVLFSKVKNMADEIFVYEYVSRLLNADGDDVMSIWDEITKSHPDMLDKVYKGLTEQMYYKDIATSYALKLIKSQGSEEYQKILADLNEFAPDEFKKMIVAEAENMSNVPESYLNEESPKSVITQDTMIRDIAMSLLEMTESDRIENLNTIKDSDQSLYQKVIDAISQLKSDPLGGFYG